MWYATYKWYDEEGVHQEIREYVADLSDYEIEKKIKIFLKDKNKRFYFAPSSLSIFINDLEYRLYFKDIADKVVIYDKYLTNESLYERNDIGAKSLITCSTEGYLGKYKETKYESNNFFYDICLQPNVLQGSILMHNYRIYNDYLESAFFNSKSDEALKQMKEKVQEYKEIASTNPDKAYFLFMEAELMPEVLEENSYFDENTGKTIENNQFGNLLTVEVKTKLITCDISEKQDMLDKILDRYRYYNIWMYGTIYYFVDDGYGKEVKDGHTIVPLSGLATEQIETKYYDITTEKEVDAVQANYNEEVYAQTTPDEILPSSTRMLERSELESMTKDELSLAYNEIFARHGHDFKTQTYKDYFNSKSWYQAITGKTVSLEELTDIEKYNANLIRSIMDEK